MGAQIILGMNADKISSYRLAFCLFLFASAAPPVSAGWIPSDFQELAVWPQPLVGGGLCLMCLCWLWLLQPRVRKCSPKSALPASHPRSSESHRYIIIDQPWGKCCCHLLGLCYSSTTDLSQPETASLPFTQMPSPVKTGEGSVSSWRIDLTEEYRWPGFSWNTFNYF